MREQIPEQEQFEEFWEEYGRLITGILFLAVIVTAVTLVLMP